MVTSWDWTWKNGLPTNQDQFEAMIGSLDEYLASQGRPPSQRPFEAARRLSMQLGYSGKPLLPLDRIEIEYPFDAGWCIKEAWLWFEAVYGDALLIDFGDGCVVLDLRGSLWRMQMPRVWGHFVPFLDPILSNKGVNLSKPGKPPVSVNILRLVEGITQPLADRLTAKERRHILAVFNRGYFALRNLADLVGVDFFEQARAEYRHSIGALLARDWAKARYDTALCAEKIFKGILGKNGKAYPKGSKGGHDIPLLGGLLHKEFGILLPKPLLVTLHCPTEVRYGEVSSTEFHGLSAHRALIEVPWMLPQIK